MPKENTLPLKVDPIRFADHALSVSGSVYLKDMERLRSSLNKDDGIVQATIQFGNDEQKIRFLRVNINTELVLQCQRCMEPFSYKVTTQCMLGLVQTEEEATQLPERYSPLVVQEGMVMLQDIIEDELIVNLPIVPMHTVSECKIKTPFVLGSDAEAKVNPFKVIETLRSERKS